MLPHMMEAAGVTEELKACDPMRWVGLMNTLTAVSYTHLTIGPAFANFAPGLAPFDWLVGIVGAVAFRVMEMCIRDRQTARAEVEKEEAAKELEEKTQEEPPAAGDDEPKKARRGRPPKEEKAEPADKEAAKPRKGRCV